MNKLFINVMFALTPVMSIMASEIPEEIEKPEPIIEHMVYAGNGIALSSNFHPSLTSHISPVLFHLGHRIQKGHNGFDYRVQILFPFDDPAYMQGSMAYQYYFTPTLPSQTYIGLGFSTGKTAESFLSLIPHIRIGKEFRKNIANHKKIFFEFQCSPNKITSEEMDNVVNHKIERNNVKDNKKRSMVPLYIVRYMPDITLCTGLSF